VWVTENFESKYKILWGNLGPMGNLSMKKKKKFQTRIYIIIPIFPPPNNIILAHIGGEGVLPSRLSK